MKEQRVCLRSEWVQRVRGGGVFRDREQSSLGRCFVESDEGQLVIFPIGKPLRLPKDQKTFEFNHFDVPMRITTISVITLFVGFDHSPEKVG